MLKIETRDEQNSGKIKKRNGKVAKKSQTSEKVSGKTYRCIRQAECLKCIGTR